ncbi:MAG: FliI/YscN family ATPase [Candidatus Caenarcaniphilales bacterium]|nr:FliI/YscN family ATPase [Candidatus Caenarcaniphilales bacterium]
MDSYFKELIQSVKTKADRIIKGEKLTRWIGSVSKIVGLMIECRIPGATIGELCEIVTDSGEKRLAEVVGFKDETSILLLLGAGGGLHQGSKVYPTGKTLQIPLGNSILGRIIDSLGRPLDGKPLGGIKDWRGIDADPPEAYGRPRIDEVFSTGVRAIDSLLTLGVGQRVGLFAGSGVGKSTLMGMIARYSDAEVNVIALVGERGREVQDFIEESLGPEGIKKSVVIIATSDQPAMFRLKCLYTATTIAEYFRDKGKKVLLMVDSVTRMAMAGREVGLSVGEPPTMKGYTPSVFAMLPRVLERAGRSKKGSITAIYSTLVDGDDFNEPIADAVRGILDGHILLSRDIAAKNHFPAINILGSVSRLFTELADKEHQAAAGDIRNIMASYQKSEDLITIGAYNKGTDKNLDRAINLQDPINNFLKQGMHEPMEFSQTIKRLKEISAIR